MNKVIECSTCEWFSMYTNECSLKHTKGYENGKPLIKDCNEYLEGYGYIVDTEGDPNYEQS